MLDTHCHIDLYPDPSRIVARAERAGVLTIGVTNLPSDYVRSRPHIRQRRRVRLALGLHPLLAERHTQERNAFRHLVSDTSYIGEIGLDFSKEGKSTAALQVESFQFVLEAMAGKPKFVTLHSRGAEREVVRTLRAANRSPVVFHWYSGPLKCLDETLSDGHYFSINPAMARSSKGRRIMAAIPRDRILTETDGPFVTVGSRKAEPSDVAIVEQVLAEIWGVSQLEARGIVAENFRAIIAPLRC